MYVCADRRGGRQDVSAETRRGAGGKGGRRELALARTGGHGGLHEERESEARREHHRDEGKRSEVKTGND